MSTESRIYRLSRGCVWLCALGALVLAGCNEQADFGPVADAATVETYRTALVAAGESAEGSEAAAEPKGTGWATIRGQFVFDGTPPQMSPYSVTKEHSICTVNGKPPLQETLLIDSASGGIKNVAIYVRDASRVHESAGPRNQPIEFDQKHCVFLTHVVAASVGETINIKNSDPTGHNTNILGIGFNQLIPEGGAIPYKVQREAAVPAKVVCSIHPWMVAYLLPRENGYFAVTDDEGRFEIANVPAGEEIELQVWHESGAAPAGGLVGATPDAPDMKWSNRGRATLTLQPDEAKEIKVIVPASAFRG
jgi:plastocyanin